MTDDNTPEIEVKDDTAARHEAILMKLAKQLAKMAEKEASAKDNSKNTNSNSGDKISEPLKAMQYIQANCTFEKEFGKSYIHYKEEKSEVDDATYRKMWVETVQLNIKAKKSEIRDIIDYQLDTTEDKDLRYFINNTKWDNTKRVMPFMKNFFLNNRDPNIEIKIKAFLIQCMRRVMNPGCNAPYMMILAGKGGAGKSLLAKFLGGDLDPLAKRARAYSDASLDFEDDKRSGELLRGKFIHELGELKNFNKADMNSLKQFVTRNEDCYRPSYGTTVVEQKRLTSFIGTTNEPKFLRDLDGLRRYIVISTSRDVDSSYAKDILAMDFWQFWSEVKVWYNQLSETERDAGINIDSIIDKDALNYIKFDQDIEDNVMNYLSNKSVDLKKHRKLSTESIATYLSTRMKRSVNHQELNKFMRFIGFNMERSAIGNDIMNVWAIDEIALKKLMSSLFVEVAA